MTSSYRSRTHVIWIAVLVWMACAGDPDPPPPDEPFLGADPSVPAGPGEARAGVIRDGAEGEAALFGGITAEGRAGDVKIYNHRVQFIIQGARQGHGYMDAGGHVIDADLVRDGGALGRDTLEDVFLAFDLARLFQASSVEIVADGSEGGAAIVRAQGSDTAWAWFQGLLEQDQPAVDDLGLEVVTTYELPPDSYSLKVTSTITNGGGETVSFTPQEGIFASGEDLLPWSPDRGLEGPGGGDLECVAFTGRQGEATVSLWPEAGSFEASAISDLAAELGISLAVHGQVELPAGEPATLVRYVTVAPDAATAEAERWMAQGAALGTVQGSATEAAGGGAIEGVRVHLVRDGQGGGVAGFAVTGSDGTFETRLPPGSYLAYAVARADHEQVALPPGAGRYGPFAAGSVNAAQLGVLAGTAEAPGLPFAGGRIEPAPVALDVVEGGTAAVDLVLEPPGEIRFEITDCAGSPLPAVIDLLWADGAPPDSPVPQELRDALGIRQDSRAAWGWTATGILVLSAIPGRYTAIVGHSSRHEQRAEPDIEVTAGATTVVETCLEEVVARDGWLAVDPHLHAAPSFDGALPMEHRLVTCAATGIDLPVTTDHDAVVEYRDLAGALGLDDTLRVVPGLEVTTLLRGHFNLYPLEPAPLTEVNGGAVTWWVDLQDTSDLFERMREAGGPEAILQVNHPRSPGMFAFAGYDPETGEPDDPDFWSWDFETIELLNGGVDDLADIRRDWFSSLNSGRIHTPVGVSDSHYRFIPCGLGRTDLYLATDSPGDTADDDLREALLAGHVVVASGTTLRATLDGALPGETVTGSPATLAATVEAPDWIVPGVLRVYRDGEVIHEEQLPDTSDQGVWFDGSWHVDAEDDAWFAVEVEGSVPMGAIWRNHTPYALTNAFFLDADGDGWTAPGLAGRGGG